MKQCLVDFDVAPGEWLIVLQWAFSRGNEPSEDLPHIRAALDAVSTEHPVFLYGDDGHHGAANSLALGMATAESGVNVPIDATTLEDEYAEYKPLIAVDERGEPSGGVNEDARMLIRQSWFEDMLGMSGDLDKSVSGAAAILASRGITTIQDALVTPESLAAYGRLEERGEMSFRLRAAMMEPPTEDIAAIDAHLEQLQALREKYSNYKYVAADGVKLFADAVMEGNPYTYPPTMPVAAALDGFRQPLFEAGEEGALDVVGYVDTDSEVCRDVQAEPDTYADVARVDSFVAETAFIHGNV